MSNVMNNTTCWQLGLAKAMTVLGGLLVACTVWAQRPQVEIRTELGTMVVQLYNETPLHRDNFIKLVEEEAYDSLLFHRVIPGLMIQAGDPDSKLAAPGAALGSGGQSYTIQAEIVRGAIHKKGALAAARQPDETNPDKRSSGSQFYIVQGRNYQPDDLTRLRFRREAQGDTVTYTEADQRAYSTIGGAPHLDGNYTVFGEVVEGLDVIDAIANLPCDAMNRPLKDLRIHMRVLK